MHAEVYTCRDTQRHGDTGGGVHRYIDRCVYETQA